MQHLAAGSHGAGVEARGNVLLPVFFASRKCRQRFTYRPGLAVPIIMVRDFIVFDRLLLDLAGGGYRLSYDAELIPSVASNHISTMPEPAAMQLTLPERIVEAFEN